MKKIFFTSTQARLNPQQVEFFNPNFISFIYIKLSHILHDINTNLAIIIIKPGQFLFSLSPFSSLLLQFLADTYKSFCHTWPEYFVTIKFI